MVRDKIRVRVRVKDRVRVGMVFKVRVWFHLSVQQRNAGRNHLHVSVLSSWIEKHILLIFNTIR